MLRYSLAALAALDLLTASLIPDDAEARARGAGGDRGGGGAYRGRAVAVRGGAAALSQCVAQAIEATAIAAGIGATAVQQRSVQRRWVPLP